MHVGAEDDNKQLLGCDKPEEMVLVLYTDGAAKAESARSLGRVRPVAGPRRKRRGTSSTQGIANRLPTEEVSAVPVAMPVARIKRERCQDAMLETARRRECCSLPQDWGEEDVDEASWGFVVVLCRCA